MMVAYTPPPSPSPRLPHPQRDRTRTRRTASPRLKIRRRSFGERPSTPTPRPASPELIFSMSPIDSHFPPPSAPKTPLNPGALFARARQQSAGAIAAITNHPRPRTPLLYSFPKTTAHLRAPPTTGTTRAESRPARFRFSPITSSSEDAPHSPEAPRSAHARTMPIAVPLPATQHHINSSDSAQYSPGSFYGSSDVDGEIDDQPAARPLKIVGFDTGTDSEVDSGGDSPFRLERYVPDKALRSGAQQFHYR